jgi:hypothetical protein
MYVADCCAETEAHVKAETAESRAIIRSVDFISAPGFAVSAAAGIRAIRETARCIQIFRDGNFQGERFVAFSVHTVSLIALLLGTSLIIKGLQASTG